MKTLKRAGLIAVAVLAALGMAGCAGAPDSPAAAPATSSPADAPSTATSQAAPETSAPVEQEPAIGVPVVDDNVQFVVNSIKCSTEPMDDDKYAPLKPKKGEFCKVNVSATALSNIGMYLGEVTITTDKAGDVSPSVGAMMYAGTLRADYIDKGQTLKGDVVFDVAKGDKITAVLVKKTALSDGISIPVSVAVK